MSADEKREREKCRKRKAMKSRWLCLLVRPTVTTLFATKHCFPASVLPPTLYRGICPSIPSHSFCFLSITRSFLQRVESYPFFFFFSLITKICYATSVIACSSSPFSLSTPFPYSFFNSLSSFSEPTRAWATRCFTRLFCIFVM